MSRPIRIESAGAWDQVMNRGTAQQIISNPHTDSSFSLCSRSYWSGSQSKRTLIASWIIPYQV